MNLPKLTSYGILTAFVFSLVWFALVVTAPLMVPSHTLLDLSGRVGYHDNDAQFASLSPLPHAIYWIGDGECHQLASRSYYLNGNQLPFCSRDFGIFLGLAVGFGALLFVRYKIHPVLAVLGLVPMGIDGGMQALTSYLSNNPLRLITGTTAGVACALLLAHFIFAFKDDQPRPKPTPAPPEPAKSGV
jgi:uncharacterized membrane protein